MKNTLTRRLMPIGLSLLMAIPFILPVSASLDAVVSTDIVAYIEGEAIASYNYNGDTMVVAEDLLGYGFDVTYDDATRSLTLARNPARPITADYTPVKSTLPVGTPLMGIVRSDIVTRVEGSTVTGYNVGGRTVIPMNELAALYDCDYVWNPTARTLTLDFKEVAPAPVPEPEPEAAPADWRDGLLAAVADAVEKHLTAIELEVPTDDIDAINELLAIYDYNTSAWTNYAYVSRWWNTRPLTKITVSISYIADKATIAAVESAVAPVIEYASSLPTAYERILYVHDYICSITEYDHAYATSGRLDYRAPQQHITGVVLNGKAVCQGYAETMEYLLNRCGVECIAVSGIADYNGGPHSWNLVYIDDDGYFVDSTWDDSTASYRYFMRTSEQMRESHTLDSHVLPEFTDESYGWYKQNGLYFESADLKKLEPFILEAMRDGADVTFEFASPAVSADFESAIFKNDYIFKLLPRAGRVNQVIWRSFDPSSPFYTLNFSELT